MSEPKSVNRKAQNKTIAVAAAGVSLVALFGALIITRLHS